MTISITLAGSELTRAKACFGKIFNHLDGDGLQIDATEDQITQHAKDWIEVKIQQQEDTDNPHSRTAVTFT